MSVELFIEGLEERGLLSERAINKLRQRAAERPMSAKALAKFLVEKKHLTQPQATEVLAGLLRSGIDVEPEAEQKREPLPELEPNDDVPDAATVDPYAEDSSIFEPFLAERDIASDADEPEIGLAPGSHDGPIAAATAVPEPDPEPAPPPEEPKRRPKKLLAKTERSEPDPLAGLEESPAGPAFDEVPRANGRGKKKDAKPDRKKRSSKKKKEKPGNPWESPLILAGGGGLVLLILAGTVIWWLLGRESGDDKLKLALEAERSGAYSQAITHYQEYLENHPRHPGRGAARVQLAMVQLRKSVEASNFHAALSVAQADVKAVEGEETFGEVAHKELAGLLPRIALGLAKEAEAAGTPEEAQERAEQATAALALASNTKYVPSSLRDEGELDQVRLTLARVQRRQQSQQDLQQALAAMEQAIAAGDTRAAYARHVELLKLHPELASEASLADMLQKTTLAEQAAIRFIKEEQAAESGEPPAPWIASLAVANRRVQSAAGAAGQKPICLRVSGAVYGIDTGSGKVLWRRYVGYGAAIWPIPLGENVLVANTARHELMLLDPSSGAMRWRQTVGEPFVAPLIVGNRTFVPAESGRLYVIDLGSGARLGYLQFAQPLRVTPAVDRKQQRMYLPGDHSSLYSIALADLTCIGVYHSGHAEGSITVPLVPVLDKLALIENNGVATSRLRLMSLGEKGEVNGLVVERRLNGLASSAPFVSGRRLIAITDRGQIEVHEVATGGGEKALTLVATRAATGDQPVVRHAALAGQFIWVGDTQLTKFSILPTGNRLPIESIENNYAGASFVHPLDLVEEAVVHVHRPKGRAGAVIAATRAGDGRTLWETDVAVPPAGAPVVDESAKAMAVANAVGRVFRFDEAAIRARVQDEPLASEFAEGTALSSAIDLGQGRAAFFAPDSDRVLLYNPRQGARAANWLQLESPLSCAPTKMGDGLIVPTQVGQVFYLSTEDGQPLAAPFQPLLEPNSTWRYQPAAVVDEASRQFVLSDGRGKLYLVAATAQPQPHLQPVASSNADGEPIESPLVVLGDTAVAVAGSSRLARFHLPSLEKTGESSLPAPATHGPVRAGEGMLLATADGQLTAISAAGDIRWKAEIGAHGDLAGEPLVLGDSVLLAYRKGIVERRSLADGKLLGSKDVEQPLAAAPAQFLQRLVLAATDGTLLVIDQP